MHLPSTNHYRAESSEVETAGIGPVNKSPQSTVEPGAGQQGVNQFVQYRLTKIKEPKLEKLSDSDDIEHFLITFERIAVAYRWQKEDWAF